MKSESRNHSRLVLGTAQLGMNYGVANVTGQPDFSTAQSIVQEAWENGIHEFDTAQAYGQSEKVLGQALRHLGIVKEAKVITKFDPNLDHLNKSVLHKAFKKSLENLGSESLYGLMLHGEDLLCQWDKGLGEILIDIVGSGRVEHLGVSVYSPEKAIEALHTQHISMVQLPTSVLERRFERASVFYRAKDLGKTIYVRSIFLQGLLLIPPDNLPTNMGFAAPALKKLVSFSQKVGVSILELCIGYIKHAFPQSRTIFGAETPIQVRENLKCWGARWPEGLVREIREEFAKVDEMILNPSLWPQIMTKARTS